MFMVFEFGGEVSLWKYLDHVRQAGAWKYKIELFHLS